MIVGTFNKIPKKTSSHSYGWARVWSDNLGVPLDHDNQSHDLVYLLHGANHAEGSDAVNLFGGYNEALEESIVNLLDAKEIISLDKPCPKYGYSLGRRKDVINKNLMNDLQKRLNNIKWIEGSDLDLPWLAVGDSHTAAYSRPNSAVVKKDGTTLFGQIREDFRYIRQHVGKKQWSGVTLSLGNIDVRHHICRNNADIRPLIDSLKDFGDSLDCQVEYSLPWPIEFEGRRLPKTGYYKGEPFSGSREERATIVNQWRDYMTDKGMNIVSCPNKWYAMDPEEYANQHMEKPQSVHLNPMSYRRMNWGIQENTLELFYN